MATPEVIVAIALGFPALIIASAALYLQWALRSPLDRRKYTVCDLPSHSVAGSRLE